MDELHELHIPLERKREIDEVLRQTEKKLLNHMVRTVNLEDFKLQVDTFLDGINKEGSD